MGTNVNAFIIRVYGIYIDGERLLVSDEIVHGKQVTKLPGGGLEYGEGTIDCLKRELMEETGESFEVVSHFYTTDFFIESAFDDQKQLISVYYMIKPTGKLNVKISEKKFDFKTNEEGEMSLRFIAIKELSGDDFTFAVDRHVASLVSSVV